MVTGGNLALHGCYFIPKSKIQVTVGTLVLQSYFFIQKSNIKVTVRALVPHDYCFMPKSKIEIKVVILVLQSKAKNKGDSWLSCTHGYFFMPKSKAKVTLASCYILLLHGYFLCLGRKHIKNMQQGETKSVTTLQKNQEQSLYSTYNAPYFYVFVQTLHNMNAIFSYLY